MMRLLRYTLLVLVVLAAAGAAAGVYLLQDPNRFKPELEALIHRQSGIPLTIGGELSWRLWPPISLSAEALAASHQGQNWDIGRLTLELDAFKVLRDPGQWNIQSLQVNDVILRQNGGVMTMSQANLRDLTPARPAPFSARLDYAPAAGEPRVPLALDGNVRVDPETLTLELRQTRFDTSDAAGVCDLSARPQTNSGRLPGVPAANADALIPVEVLLAYTWDGTCQVDWVRVDGQRFDNVTVNLENSTGEGRIHVAAADFFGGEAIVDVGIDARRTPLHWTITPTLTDVNSRALLTWLDQDLQWAAPLAYGGTITMQGNTSAELLASMSAETRFDGGQGSIDISEIREQLIPLAEQFNEGARIRAWPQVWDYQRFVGVWRIQGQQHTIDAALDNLSVKAVGDYQPVTDQLNMLAELVFSNDPALPVFDINPMLYDVPVPVHCSGAIAEPTCRLDQNAAQRIVAAALTGENPELRGRLEQKIDEQVPEEYRDAARALLEMFGNSLKRSQQER